MTHERWTDSPLDPKRRYFAQPVSPWPRRALVIGLVLAAIAAGFLGGCAYTTTRPAAEYGTVTVSWAWNQTFPDDRCGEILHLAPGNVILRFKGPPRTFRDSMECLGHELLHAMGASHE